MGRNPVDEAEAGHTVSALDVTRIGIVEAISPGGSLDNQLAYAQRELECARYIDNYARMLRETDRWRREVSRLETLIEARNAA